MHFLADLTNSRAMTPVSTDHTWVEIVTTPLSVALISSARMRSEFFLSVSRTLFSSDLQVDFIYTAPSLMEQSMAQENFISQVMLPSLRRSCPGKKIVITEYVEMVGWIGFSDIV